MYRFDMIYLEVEAELRIALVDAKKCYRFSAHPPVLVVLSVCQVALVYLDDDTFPADLVTQHLPWLPHTSCLTQNLEQCSPTTRT